MSDQMAEVEPRDCPYVGLDYYQEKFGAWFFGREAEGDKILTNLQATRLTLLHAESGVGKSSLLRAGVAWRLRRLARAGPRSSSVVDLPVVFSSWKDNPVQALIGQIRAATAPFWAGGPAPDLPSDGLDRAIEVAADAAHTSLLVILDQFEEYFLYCSREPTPERFADELARCVNRADVPANFLIAIREDAYAGLGDLFKGRIANVYGNYLHIDYLNQESAEQAIRAPLEVYNRQPGVTERVTIQDGLVDAVLDQVRAYDAGRDPVQGQAAMDGRAERFATPLLQLAMETLWRRELTQGSHELRLSTLESLEGVSKIVNTHLGQALHTLDSGERQTAIDVFNYLVTPSGGKIAESVPDLANRTAHSEDQVGTVLGKLDQARIVRPVPAPPGQDPIRFRRYEIFHDVLAPAINSAIAVREGQRRARRLRRLGALTVGLLAVSLALALTFLAFWRNAETQQQIAESTALAAVANTDLTVDPQMSVQLARQALSVSNTSQAQEALRAALSAVQEVAAIPTGASAFGAAFDPADPDRVASVGQNGGAWIWDVTTGHRLVGLSPQHGAGSLGNADAVAFNPAGTRVAVGYQYGSVIIFSNSGKQIQLIHVGSLVNSVQFVGGTGELAIATENKAVLWLPENGAQTGPVLSAGQANSIAVDPASDLEFAVATNTGTRIWTLSSGLHPVPHGGVILPAPSAEASDTAAAFSSDGSEVVTANGDNGTLRLYNAVSHKELVTLDAGRGLPECVAFSPRGQLLVAGYSSGTTIVWDTATDTQLTQLTGNNASVATVGFSGDGSQVVTASEDGTVRVWRAKPRELQAAFATSFRSGMPNPVYTAEYSPDGRQILTVDSSGFAYLVTADGAHVSTLYPPGNQVYVNSAQYNRTGTEIVTADTDGTVDLWSPGGVSQQTVPPSPIQLSSPIKVAAPASDAAFSPDGSRVVVVAGDGTADVFSTATGRRLYTLNPNSLFLLTAAVFSPNGRQILTADPDGQVEVWDAATGKELPALGAKGPGISDVEFDKAGNEFVTTADNGIVTVWSADDKHSHPIRACPSPLGASFSPSGDEVVVACSDGSVKVFSVGGQEMTSMSDPGVVNSAAFSPDGKSIVTTFGVDQTGGVRIWSAQLATSSMGTLQHLASQWVPGSLSPAQVNAALAGTSGWPSTP